MSCSYDFKKKIDTFMRLFVVVPILFELTDFDIQLDTHTINDFKRIHYFAETNDICSVYFYIEYVVAEELLKYFCLYTPTNA